MDRLSTRFGAVLERAIRTFPWLSQVRMAYCPQADMEHWKSWRQFSHVGHERDVVCWAHAAEADLTNAEIDGISAHELGHLVADALDLRGHRRAREAGKTNDIVEREANLAALALGFRVRYNDRTLEELF